MTAHLQMPPMISVGVFKESLPTFDDVWFCSICHGYPSISPIITIDKALGPRVVRVITFKRFGGDDTGSGGQRQQYYQSVSTFLAEF